MFTTDIITEVDETLLTDILLINSRSFPSEWEYKDSRNYYERKLMDKKNINIILKDNEARIGYLLAIPHNDAVMELKKDDPEMKVEKDIYYIETVGILPKFRGRGGASKIFDTLVEECTRRGVFKISMHARVINGFSSIIQRKFKASNIRRIEKWKYYNFEEPADYVEVSFGSGKC